MTHGYHFTVIDFTMVKFSLVRKTSATFLYYLTGLFIKGLNFYPDSLFYLTSTPQSTLKYGTTNRFSARNKTSCVILYVNLQLTVGGCAPVSHVFSCFLYQRSALLLGRTGFPGQHAADSTGGAGKMCQGYKDPQHTTTGMLIELRI